MKKSNKHKNLEEIMKEISKKEEEILLIITEKSVITKKYYLSEEIKKIQEGIEYFESKIRKQIEDEKNR